MKIRPPMYLAIAGALAPLVVFSAAAALLLVQHERAGMERDAVGRARSAMSAVDAHLRGSVFSLETLAASKSLEVDDIAAFHQESQKVLRTQPAWVNIGLASADRFQLSNAVYAFGKPEPLSPAEDDSFNAIVKGAKAAFGDVAPGNVVRSPTVRVRVGVRRGDEVRYVLSAPLNLKYLADVLHAQHLPEDWSIALVDREKHMIVRIPNVAAGAPASDGFGEPLGSRVPEGWVRGRTREGQTSYAAFVTSEQTGWVLGIGIPAEIVEAGARRTYAYLGAGVLAAFVAGLFLAARVARRPPE